MGFWSEQNDSLTSGNGGSIKFLTEPKTIVRILSESAEDQHDTGWFKRFEQMYQDKANVRYAVKAFDPMTGDTFMLVVPKSVFAGILSILESNERASELEGATPILGQDAHVLVITKTGTGMQTRYSVKTGTKVVSIPDNYEDVYLDTLIEKLTKPKATADSEDDEDLF